MKQIVGATLKDDSEALSTNHVSEYPASYFAKLYRDNDLRGAHVIMLGPGNEEAARDALSAWPNGLQIGGGINADNALYWLDEAGAEKVIITSYLFPNGKFDQDRLRNLSEKVGRERLVVDLSCKQTSASSWTVAMNKWQTLTDLQVNEESLHLIEDYCSEFLVHAADVEGLCKGIDQELVKALGYWSRIPCTYAGGANSVQDLELVQTLSNGRVDLTYGSSLDIFGGKLVKFDDLVKWNRRNS